MTWWLLGGVRMMLTRATSRTMDMEMMVTYNAVERDLEGWKTLFAKADKRLKLRSFVTPVGSAHSIMELVLDQA